MTIVSDVPISTPDCVDDDNWHLRLGESETTGPAGPGGSATAQRPASPEALEAQRRLHELLLRATRAQVWRLRHQLPGVGTTDLEDLAQQAADDAHLAVLRRLEEFEGRSRFSTWVYKFGILQAGVAVRRQAWRHREVTLSETRRIRRTHACRFELPRCAYGRALGRVRRMRRGSRDADRAPVLNSAASALS